INFECYSQQFKDSHVNGDLLFQLDEDNLNKDTGMVNGIHRKKFLTELTQLKICSDYSSCDPSGLNNFLQKLDKSYSQYTYKMLLNGINLENISSLNKDFLEQCGVINSFHKERIWGMIKDLKSMKDEVLRKSRSNLNKFDVFISYRRSNGSNLASLLKIYLEQRGFSVYLDVESLQTGQFTKNLLDTIKETKNFVLVLSSNALDRCVDDKKCNDWVHRAQVAVRNNISKRWTLLKMMYLKITLS
ncbi:NAD(+) hydrolase sarm1, partial [Trichonephila clavata]